MKIRKALTKYCSFEELLRSFETDHPESTAFLIPGDQAPMPVSRAAFSAAVRDEAERLSAGGKHRLGILCDGTYECVKTVFAAVLAGFTTVLLDENASEVLLEEQIKETGIDSLWGDEELQEELQPFLAKTQETQETGSGRILFFTSGTTASCKAVVLTDSSLMAAAYSGSCMLPLTPEDTLLCMLPLNHVFGMVCGLLWGMQCGSAVAMGRGMRHYADDPAYYKPTVLSAVPLLLDFLLKHDPLGDELRLILVGAGDCPKALLEAAAARGIQISFGYGLTETSSGVAISVSGDPYALEICPEDEVTLAPDGEILVRSPSCMMLGYYNRPKETDEVLKEGILFTGDLGRWDEDGKLHIIGRKKEILVLKDGTKIFLPEYEAKIMGALPGRDFAVLEQDGKPVLLLHGKEEERAEVQDKIREVMSELPRGQQISGFTFRDSPLPRTATGKIQRWELTSSSR